MHKRIKKLLIRKSHDIESTGSLARPVQGAALGPG